MYIFRASDFRDIPGRTHHYIVTRTGVKTHIYINGYRLRKPWRLWMKLIHIHEWWDKHRGATG